MSLYDYLQVGPSSVDQEDKPLTTEEIIRLALGFCFLWFIANWTLNAALAYTSVASATILSGMSGECFLLLRFINSMIVSFRDDNPCHWSYVPCGNPNTG